MLDESENMIPRGGRRRRLAGGKMVVTVVGVVGVIGSDARWWGWHVVIVCDGVGRRLSMADIMAMIAHKHQASSSTCLLKFNRAGSE